MKFEKDFKKSNSFFNSKKEKIIRQASKKFQKKKSENNIEDKENAKINVIEIQNTNPAKYMYLENLLK